MDQDRQAQNPQPIVQSQQPQVPVANTHQTEETIKSIFTIVLLVILYPLGIIAMWFLTKWSRVLKIILSVLIIPWLFVFPIVLALFLVTASPSNQFSKANNTKRSSDVSAISNAVLQYKLDHNGQLPQGITSTPSTISSQGVNLCSVLFPTYISGLSIDPVNDKTGMGVKNCSAPYDTGYVISVNSRGQIIVSAPKAELKENISITR